MDKMRIVLSALSAFSAVSVLSAKTVYLDTASTNPVAPYNSWETAAKDPATAFAAANQGHDVICVAPGTYAVSEELHMSAGSVTVKSCDKTTGEQDPENTVFDGAGLTSGSILRPNQNVKLKGLTFRNGKAASEGGAIYFKDWLGGNLIENCRFENNAATTRGGAIYFHVGNHGTVVTNSLFVGNAVTATTDGWQGGGAIFNNASSENTPYVRIVDCVASNNTTSGKNPYAGCFELHGPTVVIGGYYRNNSIATVTEGNSRGGCIWANIACVFSGVTFEGNVKANYGGVIDGGANMVVSNCVFKNLTGSVNYGILHLNNGSVIDNCTVLNSQIGTALSFQEYSTGKWMRNCLVANGNTKLFHGFSGSGTLDHCTFFGNSVSPLASYGSGQTVVRNCLLDFPGSTQAAADGSHVYVISNSYLTAAVSGAVMSGNVVGGTAGVKVGGEGMVRLRSDSPLVDKGLVLDWTADGEDLVSNARTIGSAPDIGCCERLSDEEDFQRVVARDEDRTGDWADAFVGAQNGIDGVTPGYGLLFKAGTYALDQELKIEDRALFLQAETEGAVTFDGQGKTRCLSLKATGSGKPISVQGFNFVNGATKDGDAAHGYGRGAGVYACSEQASSRIEISHCQISNCLGECTTTAGHNRGGGVYAQSYVTLENCLVADCCASNAAGGGAFVTVNANVSLGAGPIVRRCSFRNNRTYTTAGVGEAGFGAGAISENKVCFEDCQFSDNSTPNEGGGVYLGDGSWVVGSRFDGNSANSGCGAIGYSNGGVVSNCVVTGTKKGANFFAYKTGPLVTHSVFSNNLVDCHMAVGVAQTFRNCLFREPLAEHPIFLNQGKAVCTLENCTFVDCKTAIYVWGYQGTTPSAVMKNCLFANNERDFYRDPGCKSDPSCTFTSCCYAADPTFAQFTATGTVYSSNPRFVDAANGDFRIKTGSPCRDKATLLDWMTPSSVDLAGVPRIVSSGVPLAVDPNAKPDIGCYECQLVPPGMVLLLR